MKKTIFIALALMVAHIGMAQGFRYVQVKMWEGPVRGYVGGGALQRIGTPTFAEYGGESLAPNSFSSKPSLFVTLGIDMETRSEGLATGPYMHLDYFQDNWTAEFNSELPTGYNPLYTFKYDMTAQMLSGAMGYSVYYHPTESLEFGLGAGLYLMGALKLDYESDILFAANGESTGLKDEQTFYSEEAAVSKPFLFGIEAKADVLFFLTDNIFVGVQGRVDALPIFCSIDDQKNFIGSSIQASDDNRRRATVLFTIGSRW